LAWTISRRIAFLRPSREQGIKKIEVLIELFQKFAEFEAEPHFNAKASAFATPLQNHEAPLRDFGHMHCFPNVGKQCICPPLGSRSEVRAWRERCFAYGEVKFSLRESEVFRCAES
jgi:hypothetical protein